MSTRWKRRCDARVRRSACKRRASRTARGGVPLQDRQRSSTAFLIPLLLFLGGSKINKSLLISNESMQLLALLFPLPMWQPRMWGALRDDPPARDDSPPTVERVLDRLASLDALVVPVSVARAGGADDVAG